MVVMKGVEIIPKRDKVTYATNVTGKWENYNISSKEGALVKFTFETVKKLIAQKNSTQAEKEVVSLKHHLLSGDLPLEEPEIKIDYSTPKVVDLFTETFDSPLSLELVKKVQESMPCEEVKEQIEEIASEVLEEILEPVDTSDDGNQYVVTAGKNKIDRQLYLFVTEDDPYNWTIGIIPCPLSRPRCYELIEKAKRDLKVKAESSKIKNITVDVPFRVEPWKPKTEASSEENIARGKQMLEEMRRARNEQ